VLPQLTKRALIYFTATYKNLDWLFGAHKEFGLVSYVATMRQTIVSVNENLRYNEASSKKYNEKIIQNFVEVHHILGEKG
jgi:hypothetical protein